MSHAVRIDYQGISIQCQSICELASSQLCKLDHMLDELEKSSTKLLNSQTQAFREEISKTKQQLQNQIDTVLQQAKENAKMGIVYGSIGQQANAHNVIYKADELQKMTTRLADTKLIEMESLLNQLLSNRLKEHQEKLRDLANGRVKINMDVQEKINDIEDEIIKQYVYITWVEYPDLTFESLYNKAMEKKKKADYQQYEAMEKKAIEEIKTELRNEKIDEQVIDKIVTNNSDSAMERIQEIREQANSEIVNEKIRKASVKIIVKAIRDRGFIVDAKSIKIDRENNQVNIIALKPSGAKAEFKVFLDGKFEYRFDGYEGQACQKDIQPFMKDLEEVYGIKVLKQTELWSGNPDKISTMKYQTMNYNSNKR
ncbi:MAG: hypothetical protein KBC30_03470 [Planctomycetes bacterium]|nr:hypothetical protein [Planctomycetota bacterium]HPY75942.1 hypothetical protein [Planctomycetota bacterium]HQB00166.1 hypothetical protein [Planctomycetota bacterium]